jgi:hypothetical protein
MGDLLGLFNHKFPYIDEKQEACIYMLPVPKHVSLKKIIGYWLTVYCEEGKYRRPGLLRPTKQEALNK